MRDSRILLVFGTLCACLIANAYGRELLANNKCPVGCTTGKCIQDKTTGAYRCTKCVGNLVVVKATGKCGCRPGRKWNDQATGGTADLYGGSKLYKCELCPKGSWCPGGAETAANQTACSSEDPTTMDTIAMGAKSKWQCVEKPGYAYGISNGVPTATPCGDNTYNPGYQKKKCAACPAGFVALAQSDSADDCKVPEGFYLRAPGEIAPCPQGEYKTGLGSDRKCTPCGEGVTTLDSASTKADDCEYLLPGYYATAMASSGAAATAKTCPQKFWCPGGVLVTAAVGGAPVNTVGAGLNLCPGSLWTEGEGADSENQCLVPPGHKYVTNAVAACDNGEYREEWASKTTATSCTACATGDAAGYTSEPSMAIDSYTYPSGESTLGQTQVKGAPGSCVLLPGYGMYKKGSAFNVVACAANNYGAGANIYGLGVVPCRPCPTSMVTKTLSAADGGVKNTEGTGFIKPEACLTQPGYGYDGIVSTQCPAGFYNVGDNRLQCTQCPWGTTTATDTPATDQNADTDCLAAPGYYKSGSEIFECPRGTYSTALGAESCVDCGSGKWTASTASDSADDCDAMCAAGYGGASTAACAACGPDTYGPLERNGTECMACPASTVFYHDKDPGATPYSSGAISRIPAESKGDCVSEFAQIEAGLWHLPATGATVKADGTTFTDCAAECDATCMFFTFNYATVEEDPSITDATRCSVKLAPSSTSATHHIAFKAVPAGIVAGANSIDAKTIASGLYTFWPADAATAADGIGSQAALLASPGTVAACLAACDNDAQCAGVFMDATATIGTTAINTCTYIKGSSVPGAEVNVKRSMTHVVRDKLV